MHVGVCGTILPIFYGFENFHKEMLLKTHTSFPAALVVPIPVKLVVDTGSCSFNNLISLAPWLLPERTPYSIQLSAPPHTGPVT